MMGNIDQQIRLLEYLHDVAASRPVADDAAELAREIQLAVGGLRLEYQSVFIMYHDQGQSYEDKGTILEFAPPRLLKNTHWSPMSGSEDKPENYHTVTYELAEADGHTILTIGQDNNATQADADSMAETNWGPVLEGIRVLVEEQRTGA